MPKRKVIDSAIPELFITNSLNMFMFSYVLGMRRALPGVTIVKAIESFMKSFNLTEDEYSLDSAKVQYNNCLNIYLKYGNNT